MIFQNCLKCIVHSACIAKKVVGKSARDNTEIEFRKNGTRGHGIMFASAKAKRQK